MKNLIVIVLTLIFVVPPAQAHVDVVIFDHNDVELHSNGLDAHHQNHHHENDSDDEKNKEHHHHCSEVSFSNAVLLPQFNYEFIEIPEVRTTIVSYRTSYKSGYLDNLFQPPRA